MKILNASPENNLIRERFFQTIFGEERGIVALGRKKGAEFSEAYYAYPDQLPEIINWINQHLDDGDLYYCPQLFDKKKRIKENVKSCPSLWADLDDVDPEAVAPKPSVLIESSPGRYQALWLLSEPGFPQTAEEASRKIGYANDADKSGWDLTQLLRIPLTYNTKYNRDEGFPVVEIKLMRESRFKIESFMGLEDPPEFKGTDEPFPEEAIKKLASEDILQSYVGKLLPSVFQILAVPPDRDWSSVLWSLETMLFEVGMTSEEVFVVTESAAANKYKRDKRSRADLWKEILKAKQAVDAKLEMEREAEFTVGELLNDKERKIIAKIPPGFVEKYVEWGSAKSDAAPQYHEAGAFIILSAVLGEGVVLPTSYGNVVPNLWFMILGDTTLTRKTTAMEMAIDMLTTVYDESMLATDGSIEGLLSALSPRSNKTSVIWRDEFSGMLEAIKKREYYAGMLEALTKLYDGKYQKRVLRKETIEIRNSIFILLAGGIRGKIMELLEQSHITSGFIPRFIFISADADPSRYRPVGPPTKEILNVGTELIEMLEGMRNDYTPTTMGILIAGTAINEPKPHKAELSPKAWERYNALEKQMVDAGSASDEPDLYTPTLDRLSKSVLKCAVLLASARQRPDGVVKVELNDILHAISYLERWLPHTLDVIQNAGKTLTEKTLDKALSLIMRGKDSRSSFMRSMKVTARDAEWILETLEQRSMIIRTKAGKMERIIPAVAR